MAFTVEHFHDLVRLLEEHPEWRAELRRLLLPDELLELPRVVADLARKVDALAEQVAALAEQNRQLAQRVDELAEQVRALTKRVDALTERVDALVTWQKGEAGRREGERYERRMIRHAPLIFIGGDGGAPDDPVVRRKISEWITRLVREGREPEPDESPTGADLIWWKDDKVAVVEISVKVNGNDVLRALRRAEVLRSVGVDAFPVVIGQDWASLEARGLAQDKGVEWFVAGMPSDGLIAFRKLGLD